MWELFTKATSCPRVLERRQVMQYVTKVVFYNGEKAMQKGMAKMQKKGWEVVDTETVEQGFSCLKTGCLGLIFLPLALLGKKPVRYKVQYRKPRR